LAGWKNDLLKGVKMTGSRNREHGKEFWDNKTFSVLGRTGKGDEREAKQLRQKMPRYDKVILRD
jgi:hypothetical protein